MSLAVGAAVATSFVAVVATTLALKLAAAAFGLVVGGPKSHGV